MPQITLKLSLDHTNTILEALGQLPYARVYELIEIVGQQATPQVQAPAAAAVPPPAEPRPAETVAAGSVEPDRVALAVASPA